MSKQALSETDIRSKFITPAVMKAGWDLQTQIREEVSFTKGRIIVRGKLVTRGKGKRADYILSYRPNLPIALIEAKDNTCAVGDGMQQALDYAETLGIPFVFTSNGDGFVFHDRTGQVTQTSACSTPWLPNSTALHARVRRHHRHHLRLGAPPRQNPLNRRRIHARCPRGHPQSQKPPPDSSPSSATAAASPAAKLKLPPTSPPPLCAACSRP